jgi:penicillin-binding protein 2
MRRDTKRTSVFTRRALLMMGGQVAILGGLGARLYQVQVLEGHRYATLADDNRMSARMIAAPRGRILDRFGTVIAGSRINWRALLISEYTANIQETLANFSRIVPLSEYERSRIEREAMRRRRFIPVMVREFLSWEDMARIGVHAPELPGIVVDVGTTRIYPFSDRLSHIVGYVAPPNEADVAEDPTLALPGLRVGRAGMEKFHERALRGRAGAVQLEVNALGRVIRELDRQEGVQGDDVTLTIDAELQEMALRRLGDESASAVVMDCRNGEVLAMATNPSFDPSVFNSGVSQAQWREWTRDRRTPLNNKATSGLYAPGSTFKMAVALAALEARIASPFDRVECPGYFDFGDTRFHCWKQYGHGVVDLRGAIRMSCDVYFYEIARRTGMDRLSAMANRLGMGVALELDLPAQRTGLVPTRAWRTRQGRYWNIGDTIVSGIGQGYVQVTPLQLATFTARVATGRAVQPHLTRKVGQVPQAGARAEEWPALGVADRHLAAIREAMWQVVNDPSGTAPLARLGDARWQMAGKTGSSQVRRVSQEMRESGKFDSEKLPWELRPHALFVAYAPHDQPRYALSVVVEHGNAGAAMAAPIARDIMLATLQRDPVNRPDPNPARVAGADRPRTPESSPWRRFGSAPGDAL